jgi:hypothetical protein
MEFSYAEDLWPMNENNCKAFGKRCEYFSVCTEKVTLDESKKLVKGRNY